MVVDIIAFKKNILHKKSWKYRKYQTKKEIDPNRKTSLKKQAVNIWKLIYDSSLYSIYRKYFGVDTKGWIVVKTIRELIEIILQSQALLLYNGYNIFDSNNEDDIYLANKPQFIILFSCLLASIVLVLVFYNYVMHFYPMRAMVLCLKFVYF